MVPDLLALADAKIGEGKLLDASHILETALVIDPGTIQARWKLGQVYILLKEIRFRALARENLETLIDMPGLSPQILNLATRLLISRVYAQIGPAERIEPLFRRTREHFSDAEAANLERIIAEGREEPSSEDGGRKRSTIPATREDIANGGQALRAFIFNDFRTQMARRETSGAFFTFGSCFAGNVARSMKAAGVKIESFFVGEEVNTTFSNTNLLRFILGEAVEHRDYYAGVLEGLDIEKLRAALGEADNVIYTLGLAPAFFTADGDYVPHDAKSLRGLLKRDDVSYRFSTVDENVRQLRATSDLLRRHTRVKTIFLTVSPVPLQASLASTAAAVDDSESKAILRTAAGAVCREAPELFTYFPSFEAFRWLPCFQDAAAFGADDGSLRHVNDALVDQVVDIFMSSTSTKAAGAA